MYTRYEWDRQLGRQALEEQLRLMREINAQPMSWNKLGKMIQLGALMHERDRRFY